MTRNIEKTVISSRNLLLVLVVTLIASFGSAAGASAGVGIGGQVSSHVAIPIGSDGAGADIRTPVTSLKVSATLSYGKLSASGLTVTVRSDERAVGQVDLQATGVALSGGSGSKVEPLSSKEIKLSADKNYSVRLRISPKRLASLRASGVERLSVNFSAYDRSGNFAAPLSKRLSLS